MQTPLSLKDIQPLGSGEDRIVYPHPHNDDLCIKIARRPASNLQVKGFRDTLLYLLRGCRKDELDFNYVDLQYTQYLTARGGDELFRHIPRCYGTIETDMGTGVVWQRIRDFDGKECTNLLHLKNRDIPLTDREKQQLWSALQEFFSWQLNHGIMLREMAYTNSMVCRTDSSSIRIYHIDAIGCADLFPLARHALWFARLRVLSKVNRFRKRMRAWLQPGL